MICSLNLTCRVSVRLSQSLPALSEHSVFLCFSCVYRLEHPAYNAKHMGKLQYFLWKKILLGYFSRRGVPSGKRYQKGIQKLRGSQVGRRAQRPNREIVSFRSCVRARGDCQVEMSLKRRARVFPFPFSGREAFPFPFWTREAFPFPLGSSPSSQAAIQL